MSSSSVGGGEGAEDFWATVRLIPTRSGAMHPALQLSSQSVSEGDDRDSPSPGVVANNSPDSSTPTVTQWEDLPALTTVNLVGDARPGATVLLEGEVEEVFGVRADPSYGNEPPPAFVFQRYGAGISAILAVHDTWLWQMHDEIPLEDQMVTLENMVILFNFYPRLRFNRDTDAYRPLLPKRISILGKIVRSEVEEDEEKVQFKSFGVKFMYAPIEYSSERFTFEKWEMIRPFKENRYFKEVHKSLNGLIAFLESQSRE